MRNDTWTARWDERYRSEAFAYGEAPNEYLKTQLIQWQPGHILFPAEGEGRNAVFAASMGWSVAAFDISEEGKKKALQLAARQGLNIDYRVGELPSLPYLPGSFDAIALIYAHFPAAIKSAYHWHLATLLRPGGILIFEAFSKNHLDYVQRDERVGGPKDIDQLFSLEELQQDFSGFDCTGLAETEVQLSEGLFHNGTGSVIRGVAVKG